LNAADGRRSKGVTLTVNQGYGSPMQPGMPGNLVNPMAASAPGVVPMDVPCRKCGYNLRGLSVDGRCPECGIAVGLSTYGDLLRYSDPAWLAKLRTGVTLILWGILAMVVTVVLLVVVFMVIGFRTAARGGGGGGGTPASGAAANQAIVMSLATLVGYGLMLVGAWLLTEPDPSGLGEDQYGTSRKLIRIMLGLGVLNYLINIGINAATITPSIFVTLQSFNFIFQIAGLVGTCAQLQYLKKLAVRIPDDSLAGRAHTILWGIGVTNGIMIVFGFVTSVLILRPGMTPGMMPGTTPNMGAMGALVALGCFTAIAGIAVLVFGIMYLFMLDRFRRAFAEQAAASQATWTAMAMPGGAAPPLPGMA
jgi:hypothetical protein